MPMLWRKASLTFVRSCFPSTSAARTFFASCVRPHLSSHIETSLGDHVLGFVSPVLRALSIICPWKREERRGKQTWTEEGDILLDGEKVCDALLGIAALVDGEHEEAVHKGNAILPVVEDLDVERLAAVHCVADRLDRVGVGVWSLEIASCVCCRCVGREGA